MLTGADTAIQTELSHSIPYRDDATVARRLAVDNPPPMADN